MGEERGGEITCWARVALYRGRVQEISEAVKAAGLSALAARARNRERCVLGGVAMDLSIANGQASGTRAAIGGVSSSRVPLSQGELVVNLGLDRYYPYQSLSPSDHRRCEGSRAVGSLQPAPPADQRPANNSRACIASRRATCRPAHTWWDRACV